MKLEAATLEKIKNRITVKVMEGSGTWIDWQYLLDASALLAKCRYTLQYTYPYAYYLLPGARKELVSMIATSENLFYNGTRHLLRVSLTSVPIFC